MPKPAHSSLTLSCAADSAAINRTFSSIEQISRHGIASLLLPCHSICYPSCRVIQSVTHPAGLYPRRAPSARTDLSLDKERLGLYQARYWPWPSAAFCAAAAAAAAAAWVWADFSIA